MRWLATATAMLAAAVTVAPGGGSARAGPLEGLSARITFFGNPDPFYGSPCPMITQAWSDARTDLSSPPFPLPASASGEALTPSAAGWSYVPIDMEQGPGVPTLRTGIAITWTESDEIGTIVGGFPVRSPAGEVSQVGFGTGGPVPQGLCGSGLGRPPDQIGTPYPISWGTAFPSPTQDAGCGAVRLQLIGLRRWSATVILGGLPRLEVWPTPWPAPCFASSTPTPTPPSTPGAPAARCKSAKLIAVRGTGDNLNSHGRIGSNISGALVKRARSAGVTYGVYGLPYPARGWPDVPRYPLSKNKGRDMLRAFIKNEVKRCPMQNLALVGYSQGAHVVGDVLSRGPSGGLTPAELSRIRAVALIADPRFNPQEPFTFGSFGVNRRGRLGARSPGDLNADLGRIRAWCRRGDYWCQKPLPWGLSVRQAFFEHKPEHYWAEHKDDIVNFIALRLGWGTAGP